MIIVSTAAAEKLQPPGFGNWVVEFRLEAPQLGVTKGP